MKKKNEPISNDKRGVSTKSYKPKKTTAQPVAEEVKKPVRALTKKGKIIIIAVSAVLLAVLIFGAIFAIILNVEEENFNYLTTDLSHYIEIDEGDYKDGFVLNLNIFKPRLKNSDGSGVSDVEVKIMSDLASGIKGNVINSGGRYSAGTVAVGDDVYLYYRGYTMGEDGKEVDLIGLHNYYLDSDSVVLEDAVINVGSGTVPFPGFEAGLVGKNTENYAKLTKITDRAATANDVVYISAERLAAGADESKSEIGSYVRIDLSLAENSQWRDVLVGRKPEESIPDFNITVDGVEYSYSSAKIDFITEGEKSGNVLTVEAYVPSTYTGDASLIGKSVYFDVFVEGIVYHNEWHSDGESAEYTLGYDFNDEYITSGIEDGSLGITAEELQAYTGNVLTEKYESYIYKTLLDEYEEECSELLEGAVWDYLFERAKVKKYPTKKVDEIYSTNLATFTQSYTDSEGYIYNQYTGYNQMCQNIDEYMIIYLDLVYAENQDWRSVIYADACDLVKERLIIYYILKKEKADLSDAAVADAIAVVKEELLEASIEDFLAKNPTYTEKDYEDHVEKARETISSSIYSEYIKDRAYAKMALEIMLDYAEVKTLSSD